MGPQAFRGYWANYLKGNVKTIHDTLKAGNDPSDLAFVVEGGGGKLKGKKWISLSIK